MTTMGECLFAFICIVTKRKKKLRMAAQENLFESIGKTRVCVVGVAPDRLGRPGLKNRVEVVAVQ